MGLAEVPLWQKSAAQASKSPLRPLLRVPSGKALPVWRGWYVDRYIVAEAAQNTPPFSGLTPWKPGQSGNPGGRPKSKVLRALLEPHRRSMIARLLLVMRNGKDREAIEAIKVMLAYTDGKPGDLPADSLSDSELLAIVLKRKSEAQPA